MSAPAVTGLYLPMTGGTLSGPGNLTVDGIVTLNDGVHADALNIDGKPAATQEYVTDAVDDAVTEIKNLGHFVGSFNTYAAVPTNASGFPAAMSVNDFITVRADENYGDVATRYVLSNIAADGTLTWTYDISYSTDIDQLNFRAMPASNDIHDWLTGAGEGQFAGEGNGLDNMPELAAGEGTAYKFIGLSNDAEDRQTILAFHETGNRMYQTTYEGGVWLPWQEHLTNGYVDSYPAGQMTWGPQLITTGAVLSTGFTSQWGSGWTEAWLWDGNPAQNTLAYQLDAPTVPGQWYLVSWSAYTNYNPSGTIYLRTGPTVTAGQQQASVNGLYSGWAWVSQDVVQATAAFTHLVFVNDGPTINNDCAIYSPTVQSFNVLAQELAQTTPVPESTDWVLDSGSGATGVWRLTSQTSALLTYTLAQPTQIARQYLIRWRTAVLGPTFVYIQLRLGPNVTTAMSYVGDPDVGPGDWSFIVTTTAEFTHLVIEATADQLGTFQLLSVTPLDQPITRPLLLNGVPFATRGTTTLIGSPLDLLTAGADNAGFGVHALSTLTTGSRNVAVGVEAARYNSSGSNNTVLGYRALRGLTNGGNNVVIGNRAGEQTISCNSTVLIGSNNAATTMFVGTGNAIVGSDNLGSATNAGSNNVIIGSASASRLAGASQGVYIGNSAGGSNATGSFFTAVGSNALNGVTAYQAESCTGVGFGALYMLTSGRQSTAVGSAAGYNITAANRSVLLGYSAGRYRTGTTSETNYDDCLFLGNMTRSGVANAVNQIVIGNDTTGAGSNSVTLGNASNNNYRCQVAWTIGISDVRGKEQIEPANLDLCLQAVRDLPVKRWKWKDFVEAPADRHVTGWLADDMAKLFPKTVRTYDEVYRDRTIADCQHMTTDHALPTLWGAVQKLIETNERLEREIKELRHGRSSRTKPRRRAVG